MTPFRLAVSQASSTMAGFSPPSAGVMPVKWNHEAPVQNALPVVVGARGRRRGRAGAVVNDVGGPLGRAFFAEIDADAVAAEHDVRRIHPPAAQIVAAGDAERIGGSG